MCESGWVVTRGAALLVFGCLTGCASGARGVVRARAVSPKVGVRNASGERPQMRVEAGLPAVAAALPAPAPAKDVAQANGDDAYVMPVMLEKEAVEPPVPAGCPTEMSLLPGGVCVDRWEGSLVLVTTEGKEQDWSPFVTVGPGVPPVKAVSRAGVFPQGYLTGVRAAEACENAGKRLCTSEEWQVACQGPERTTYPYGERREAHRCNDDGRGKHPLIDLTERLGLAPEQMWRDSMEHPMINQLPNTLRKTGERSGCTNAYGVFDMVGNLHEWVDDAAGTFRGGFYMDTRINGEGCRYVTTAHNRRYHDYSTGFRCCMDSRGGNGDAR